MSNQAIPGSAAQPLDLSSLPDVAALTAQQAHLIERDAETWLLEHPAVEDAAVVVTGFTRDERVTKCARCGIASVFPGVDFDDQLVCSLCRDYEENRDQILRYFGRPDAFGELIRKRAAEADGEFDCLLLYSGGKDSTYVLFQLLELGLKVMTYTFDNGFISKTALRNVEEITQELGVPHVTLTRVDQPKIFLESLHEHKSVCNGCFRSLLEIGHQVAAEHGIPSIVTGLSRGQIIDERLSWFYRNGIYDPERIDADLDSGRQVYHLLHRGGENYIGDRVKVVDFFRYSEVTKEDIRRFLAEHPSWSQPADTGFCSSNCLINDVGVFVHKLERGYHNYEAPTRWEVRLGHLTKSVADEELVDPTVNRRVTTLLDRIGYDQPETREILAARMIAYVVTNGTSIDEVRAWAEQNALGSVPRILPSRWVPLSAVPRIGGALEFRSLPRMSDSRFDAVPMEPEATPTPVGFLEPTRALALAGADRPRARAVALDIPWGIAAGRIAVAVAAAASEVPEARLQWTASEPPEFERVPAGRAWVKRLDLARSSSEEWPQQVRTLTARLLARHDPHAGCLQAFMLDGPKGTRVLVLTADESGLGPDGLAPVVGAIGRILGIWETPQSTGAAQAREEAVRWLRARDGGARIRVSGGGAPEGDASEHGVVDVAAEDWTTELVVYDGAGVPGAAAPYRELDARFRRFADPVRPDGAPADSIVVEPAADGWRLVPESGEAVEMPVTAAVGGR